MRDFLKNFPVDSYIKADYIIIFDNERPNISNNDKLKALGSWKEYGIHGYRIMCSLSKEKFTELISNELGINKTNFKIFQTHELAGIRI